VPPSVTRAKNYSPFRAAPHGPDGPYALGSKATSTCWLDKRRPTGQGESLRTTSTEPGKLAETLVNRVSQRRSPNYGGSFGVLTVSFFAPAITVEEDNSFSLDSHPVLLCKRAID